MGAAWVPVVIDRFSRRVVGWSMSAEMTAQLVTDALVMAIWRRGKPDALLHHSDRGSPIPPASSSRSSCAITASSAR
jgi:putative transposase